MKDLSARVEELIGVTHQLRNRIEKLEKDALFLSQSILPVPEQFQTEPPKAETTPKHRECRENEHEHQWAIKSLGMEYCIRCLKVKPSPTKESCEHQWVKIYSDTGLSGKYLGTKCRHCSMSISDTKESKTLAQKFQLLDKNMPYANDLERIATNHFKARFEEAWGSYSIKYGSMTFLELYDHLKDELFGKGK